MSMPGQRIDRTVIGQAIVLLLLVLIAFVLLRLQRTPWPALTPIAASRWWALAAAVSYLLFCGWIFRHRLRRKMQPVADTEAGWKVIHASQTGLALELAERTLATLRQAGQQAELIDIAALDPDSLPDARCLFVASTTGEGDPPDPALRFASKAMHNDIDLSGTRYAVLALGDRSYAHFCAFGHQLDVWLRRQRAHPLFDLVEVDNADAAALRHWQHHLGVLTDHTEMADWSPPSYQPWTLAERRHLNPGSAGGPAFHIALQANETPEPTWQAGDIVEIGPRNSGREVDAWLATMQADGDALVEFNGEQCRLRDALSRARLPDAAPATAPTPQAIANALEPLPHREYSIANIPGNGQLHLLVRQMQREDGTPGIGSGWLCLHAEIGGRVDLRIRRNPNFHAPAPALPMILIGNGTGLAGLRAHLQARIAAGAHRNWLLFGERHSARDSFHAAELDGWLAQGKITHIDRVFSRDGGKLHYVQDALRANTERLRTWLQQGAVIYVCGSLQGMAPGVDAVLLEALGQDGVDALIEAGRYRRDVY